MTEFKKGCIPWNRGLLGFGKEFGFKKSHQLGFKKGDPRTRENSITNGRKAIESGHIFKLNGKAKFLYHQDHYHRSRLELKYCERLQKLYDSSLLFANVHYKSVEIDWIFGTDRRDPSTWLKIIEYHPIRSWEGETKESYVQSRTSKLRSLGITCPIEVVNK